MIELNDVKQVLDQTDERTLTLYLNVAASTPENQAQNPAWQTYVRRALREMESSLGEGETGVWADIKRRAQQFFDDFQSSSQGLAYICGPTFERSFELPMPIDNQAYFGRPVVTPLLWAIDEYELYLIALVDQQDARFFTSALGSLGFQDAISMEYPGEFGSKDARVHPQGESDVTRGSLRDEFQDRMEEEHQRFYRQVAAHIEDLMAKHKTRRVILGGNELSAHAVQRHLSPKAAEAVVDVVNIPMRATPREIITQVQPAALEYERQQEIKLVEQVIDFAKKGGRGALGWNAVRQALDQQRVELLVLPWPTPDDEQATSLVMKTFASGGKVELVHGEAAGALGGEGGVAARLYYAL